MHNHRPRSTSLLRVGLGAVGVAIAAACVACKDGASPETNLLGDHSLLRVNGVPLPASMNYLGMRVTSGTLRLERGTATEYLNTCIGYPNACTSQGHFTAAEGWSVSGSDLSLWAGSALPARHGLVTDTLITVYWSGDRLEYRR